MIPQYARRLGYGSVVLSSSALVTTAAAQSVLAPIAPYYPGQTPSYQVPGSSSTEGNTQSAAAGLLGESEDLLKWGFARLHPHLSYRLYYADGLQAVPGYLTHSTINEISPGILLNLGTHWTLDYTPTIRYYSNSQFKDGVDQSVALAGQTDYNDWSFGLNVAYTYYSQPLIETGAQTGLGNIGTRVTAKRPLGGAWSLDLSLYQGIGLVDDNPAGQSLANLFSYSTMDWVDYKLASKVTFGLGVGLGYDDVSGGTSSDMAYEQLQGRVIWKPSEKLSFSLNGGLEDRQFLDSQVSDALNPVFGMSLAYQPAETTVLMLTGSRTMSPSYFEETLLETSTIVASLNQRLLKRLFLGVNGGYSRVDYSATATTASVNRNDDNAFVGARLTARFLKRGSATLFYQFSKNLSNESGFGYTSNQTGLELGYYF